MLVCGQKTRHNDTKTIHKQAKKAVNQAWYMI